MQTFYRFTQSLVLQHENTNANLVMKLRYTYGTVYLLFRSFYLRASVSVK